MENTVIKFDQVSKIYKLYKSDKQRLLSVFIKNLSIPTKRAVDNVSFEIKKGEAVALFGQNGAGKSTILKMITGVCYPTEGDIQVDGIVSALLELSAGFDVESTGRGNIYLKGQLMGLSNEKIKELEPAIIDFTELGEYIDQPVRTYSSGMKARLGFSINANIQPEILIVDEALSVGDKAFRQKCYDKINQLLEDGITLLFVTHSVEAALNFCSRGIILQNGKITFDGGIQEAIDIYNEQNKKKAAKGKKK